VSETVQHSFRLDAMIVAMVRKHKKVERKSARTTRASVLKEMGKPRTSRSARIKELNLDTSRIPERSSTSVDKIISSQHPSRPEKAEIAVDGADDRYRDFRIENTLADENGEDVRLKKGAHVDVTVTAKNANGHN
jgi:hypothetical protein